MSNKNLLAVIGIIIAIAIIVGIIYWSSQRQADTDVTDEERAVEELSGALEQGTQVGVDVPVVNPLDEAVPDVNPLEAANPFKIKNPFQ